jgi:hypothetical protein
MAQQHDEGIKIIKQMIAQGEEKYKCFQVDPKGIIWFNGRMVVPKDHQLRKQILDEAHLSKFSMHPGSTKMYQDLKQNFWWTRMKREIAKYVSTFTHPLLEVGRYQHGFYHWLTQHFPKA